MGHIVKPFLEPRSIAVVGASKTVNRPGYIVVRNLREFGFTGEVYPVNPQGGEVLGFKMYKSIQCLPENIDLAFSMVPADETFELLSSCAAKGIKSVVLASGGFSESGLDGKKRQNEVVSFARENGIRIIGPNAQGPVSTSDNLGLTFCHLDSLKKGDVAFIAQSGQFCGPVLEFINSSLNLGISKSIDLGNCCDIDETHVMEYLENDPETKVIAVYMESIRGGERFLKVARRISKKKPIIVLKTGRTEDGLRTATSHTGAMKVNDTIFDVALKQAGIIRAGDMDEFLDLAKVFSGSCKLQGNRVGVVTYSGGIGTMVADACSEFGLRLAELSNDTIEKIVSALPPPARISNPLDLYAVSIPLDTDALYGVPIKAFMEDVNVDAVLSCFYMNRTAMKIDVNHLLSELVQIRKKPMAVWLIGEYGMIREYTNVFEENGVPVFASPERAIRALGALWRYSSHFAE